ncbi:hypothetical protein Tco_1010602 [Tanacetum coccineum]
MPDAHGPVQPWLSSLAQKEDPRESFNQLMDTLLDFSAFVMNWLKVDTLTPELLAEVYKATTDQLDWINPEGQQYPHDLRKPLPLIPNTRGRRVIPFDHFINNDLEYLSGGVSIRRYGMLLFLVQCKLTNLTVEERLAFNVSLRMFTRSVVIQRRLEDLQLGIRMEYLPQTIWRQSDKDKAGAMIQEIDKQLKTRSIMRSLEKFVGGRPYERDFRLLYETVTLGSTSYRFAVCILRLVTVDPTDLKLLKDGDEEVTSSQTGKLYKMAKRDYASVNDLKCSSSHQDKARNSSNLKLNDPTSNPSQLI